MKVKDLKRVLEKLDEEMEVLIDTEPLLNYMEVKQITVEDVFTGKSVHAEKKLIIKTDEDDFEISCVDCPNYNFSD